MTYFHIPSEAIWSALCCFAIGLHSLSPCVQMDTREPKALQPAARDAVSQLGDNSGNAEEEGGRLSMSQSVATDLHAAADR